jgi:hypothetical protein
MEELIESNVIPDQRSARPKRRGTPRFFFTVRRRLIKKEISAI